MFLDHTHVNNNATLCSLHICVISITVEFKVVLLHYLAAVVFFDHSDRFAVLATMVVQ